MVSYEYDLNINLVMAVMVIDQMLSSKAIHLVVPDGDVYPMLHVTNSMVIKYSIILMNLVTM